MGKGSKRSGKPLPTVSIQPQRSIFQLDLKDIWHFRELLYLLIWRDVKVRYKQTVIGAAWAILQPFMTMVVFTMVFSKFAKVPSDGIPYPIFSYTALLPWNYFSQALSRGGVSLVGSSGLISKVYFPRLIIPLSSVITPLVDFLLAFAILIGMMVWFRFTPTLGVLALPLFILLAMMTALAIGLWSCALHVQYRDVGYLIPFVIQIWMYATPVAYPLSLVPDRWKLLYSLNPMVGVVEGFRWAMLGRTIPDIGLMAVSGSVVLVLLFTGLLYFKRMERTFADII
ncbi:MAG: ABC transporter permease [Armatimonadetes bacterium]|nr:ABC transporter permease [Armatimonadota bacterium]